MEISLLRIVESTTVDGPGLRTSVYAAGCSHHCPGCHNPQTWDVAAGTPTDTDTIAQHILANPVENVTFSGGDPMFQPEAFAELARKIKSKSNKTIWCYTGFRIEALLNNPKYMPLLEQIDVLVDGPYINSRRNTNLLFRGSDNQRLIKVDDTLKRKEVVEYNPLAKFDKLLRI